MGSAAEAECGGLYMNAQEAVPFITTLEELRHKQHPVSLRTNNSTANGIMNQQIKQKWSKAFDMRFFWLIDRISQGQFKVDWHPGKLSISDYFTKHHPASHHQLLRPIYFYIKGKSLSAIQGCIEILKRASAPKRSTPWPVISNLMSKEDRPHRLATWTVSSIQTDPLAIRNRLQNSKVDLTLI